MTTTYHPVEDARAAASFVINENVNNDSPITLGFQFTVSVACMLNAIRWYLGNNESPAHPQTRVGKLWSTTDLTSGTELAASSAIAPSGLGWQTLPVTPVILSPSVLYVAGVYHPDAGYCANGTFFTAGGPGDTTIGPVTMPNNTAAVSGQGMYNYGGAIALPNNGSAGTNYWTDVEITTIDPVTWTWNYQVKQGS